MHAVVEVNIFFSMNNAAQSVFRRVEMFTNVNRDEDVKLLELVKSHGKFDWRLFSHELGGDKNRKSVRRRYVQLLTRLQYDTFENVRSFLHKYDCNLYSCTTHEFYLCRFDGNMRVTRDNRCIQHFKSIFHR